MSEPAVAIRGVTKFFGDFPAIRGVNLDIPRGSTLALLGRNGAGKTTLLHMLAGLSEPTDGTIRIGVAGDADIRRRVGLVGHGQWLYDDLTAAENLSFFGDLYGVQDVDARITKWLERTGLARFRDARVSGFSRGMRQRLAIARAFLHEPDLLLLDEPWTALDDRAIDFLSGLIRDARNEGRTVVVCSHQLREALEIADEIALLNRGRIAWRGPNDDELRQRPETLYDRIS
ncbi:MAG: ABC transporter ATP-binding protein [Acidobacteria bacterium]|nr:ABC transporter ATP-binding protein [Acidobacteriota bacterium]